MTSPRALVLALTLGVVAALAAVPRALPAQTPAPAGHGRLAVIWSSADPEVAERVCFMYTQNASKQKWFDEVTLIVWGPSARVLASNKALQDRVKAMEADGVTVKACLACADSYGVTATLRQLGIDVRYMGRPLTDMLEQGWKVLTF